MAAEEQTPQREAKRLTSSLWSRLNRRTIQLDDNCNIEHSGYQVMLRYLLRWHGSLYTLLWLDVLIWCVLYAIISLVYRLVLGNAQKNVFENLVRTIGFWSGEIPITFLLGFFVSNIVSRWWTMYNMIPKMGGTSCIVRACVQNCNPDRGLADPQRAELLRKAISRYLNLAWVLCIWQFSGHLRERFNILREIIGKVNEVEPAWRRQEYIEYNSLYNFRRKRNDPIRRHLENIRVSEKMQAENLEMMIQDLCLLNEDPVVKKTFGDLISSSEIEIFAEQARRRHDDGEANDIKESSVKTACFGSAKVDDNNDEVPPPKRLFANSKQLYRVQWWLPLHWALALAEQAMEEGFVHDTNTYVCLTTAIHSLAGKLTALGNHATRNLPLVYTQVVIIAVYTAYFANLIGRQFLNPARASAAGISGYWLDYYVPVFALLQIIFIVGWLKVALVLMDPFGSDDQDFPLGDIFNGNLNSGMEMSQNSGELYPKKLLSIISPTPGCAGNDDCVHSDAEDVQPVLLTDPTSVAT